MMVFPFDLACLVATTDRDDKKVNSCSHLARGKDKFARKKKKIQVNKKGNLNNFLPAPTDMKWRQRVRRAPTDGQRKMMKNLFIRLFSLFFFFHSVGNIFFSLHAVSSHGHRFCWPEGDENANELPGRREGKWTPILVQVDLLCFCIWVLNLRYQRKLEHES